MKIGWIPQLKWGLVTLLAMALMACAGQPSADTAVLNLADPDAAKVFGGREVGGEDPFLKFIVAVSGFNASGDPIECTGTLIHPQVVLTAAHCVDGSEQTLRSLRLRFHALQFQPSVSENERSMRSLALTNERRAAQIYRHEMWDHLIETEPRSATRIRYDIALIVLRTPAPDGTEPIRFAGINPSLSTLSELTAVGYGAIGGFVNYVDQQRIVTSQGAGTLRTATLQRAAIEKNDIHFETAQYHKGICYGDSGSPALTKMMGRWVQVGVASYITSLGDKACRQTGYFLKMAATDDKGQSLADWIDAKLASLN